jgi:hypothetical protein
MAKKAPRGQPPIDPVEADTLLLDLAASLLAEHFFDPETEARYLELYPSRRAPPDAAPLTEEAIRQDGRTLEWQLEALGQRNGFRVTMRHPKFTASVEGVWQFQRETLSRGRVVERAGDPKLIAREARSLLNALTVDEPNDEDLADLLAVLSGHGETSHIGDDSNQPPPATPAECDRALALVERLCRKSGGELRPEDRMWLETTPQTLPVLTDLMIEAMTAQPRAENRIAVCLDLVTQQLEFVRYRVDRGWDWASAMLADYQQRLIALGQASTLEAADWFAMAGALSQARVPVSDEVQLKLAEAGTATASSTLPPDQLLGSLRQLSDELAEMADSPFEVIEALYAAGAVMPSKLRSFMATELALSAHAALQQAVPLMLLDPDSDVRRSAAAATEQTATTVSPDSLRRAITVRNWIPEADRPDLDRAIRKVRASGVPIGAWPSASDDRAVVSRIDIAFHASMVDGSGAQSILAISRGGKKGLVAGLLLKHGAGVGDAWIDPAVSRADINSMLRDLKSEVPSDEVDRSYVDAAIQHAIAAGVAHGAVPATSLLAIAEATGGSEWKDRQLDVAAEGERLFSGLAAGDRSPEGVQAALDRGVAWMQQQPIAASWFEDTKAVREVIAKVPRKDAAAAARVVLNEVLPGTRLAWAERFLLMALWCQAATTKAYRAWVTEFTVLTRVLTSNVSLETIPIMNRIALQTVMAARSSGW